MWCYPCRSQGYSEQTEVGERVKVLKCPKTGEYIMLMHTDNLQYKDPVIVMLLPTKLMEPTHFRGLYYLMDSQSVDGIWGLSRIQTAAAI